MPKAKPLGNEEFLCRVRDYLPMDAVVWNLDDRHPPHAGAVLSGLEPDRFYFFDSDSVLAASHAIEELALEEASGSLLAVMQDFRNFEPHRERYWQLAATLDVVRVIGKGRKRPSHDHLKFVTTSRPPLLNIWAVLYEGPQAAVMFMGRQTNTAPAFEKRRFLGLYTFDPSLIARARGDIEGVVSGRASGLPEFDRLLAIDHAARQTGLRFDREQRSVEAAFRKLRLNGADYQPADLAVDLGRSLGRLRRFAEQLPARVGSRRFPSSHD